MARVASMPDALRHADVHQHDVGRRAPRRRRRRRRRPRPRPTTSMPGSSSRTIVRPRRNRAWSSQISDPDGIAVPDLVAGLGLVGHPRERTPAGPGSDLVGDRRHPARRRVAPGLDLLLGALELVGQLLEDQVDRRERIGGRRLGEQPPPAPSTVTSHMSRAAILGLRSSRKCTSARSSPAPKRLRRPSFASAAARRAGEISMCRALTVTSTRWRPPGSSVPADYCRGRPPDRGPACKGSRVQTPLRRALAAMFLLGLLLAPGAALAGPSAPTGALAPPIPDDVLAAVGSGPTDVVVSYDPGPAAAELRRSSVGGPATSGGARPRHGPPHRDQGRGAGPPGGPGPRRARLRPPARAGRAGRIAARARGARRRSGRHRAEPARHLRAGGHEQPGDGPAAGAVAAGATGAGTAVAVLDTGLNPSFSPSLYGNCSGGPGTGTCRVAIHRNHDGSTGFSDVDPERHGSNVTSVAATVAPDARILSYGVFFVQGAGLVTSDPGGARGPRPRPRQRAGPRRPGGQPEPRATAPEVHGRVRGLAVHVDVQRAPRRGHRPRRGGGQRRPFVRLVPERRARPGVHARRGGGGRGVRGRRARRRPGGGSRSSAPTPTRASARCPASRRPVPCCRSSPPGSRCRVPA